MLVFLMSDDGVVYFFDGVCVMCVDVCEFVV